MTHPLLVQLLLVLQDLFLALQLELVVLLSMRIRLGIRLGSRSCTHGVRAGLLLYWR
jgi:hypothetical protein